VNRKTASNLPHLALTPESKRPDRISGHGPLQPLDERAPLRQLREVEKDRSFPKWFATQHHRTHHRGQVTTLLMQAGIDPRVTDLLWLPGMEETGQRP